MSGFIHNNDDDEYELDEDESSEYQREIAIWAGEHDSFEADAREIRKKFRHVPLDEIIRDCKRYCTTTPEQIQAQRRRSREVTKLYAALRRMDNN